MSYYDIAERRRHGGVIQTALCGATITDAGVYVNGAGEIAIEMIEARLQDGRVVSFGPPRLGTDRWADPRPGDVILEIGAGDDRREMTVQQDFSEVKA